MSLSSSLLMNKRERNLFDDMSSREFNEWVTIDPAYLKSFPEEGCEVLLFFDCFNGYDVGYCTWEEADCDPDNKSPKVLYWYVGGKLVQDMYQPTCWQKISTSHDKTKNHHQ